MKEADNKLIGGEEVKPNSPISMKKEQLGREILAIIYESLLADGHVDPNGKTEEQIMRDVRRVAVKWSHRRPMLMSTDFRASLLSKARRSKRLKDYHEAALFYATWFEHWINGVLLRKLRSLDDQEACQMVRDVNLRGKYTWLLALVHGQRISRDHLNTVLRVAELRNEFVHYKYKLVDVDHDDSAQRRKIHRKAESAVRYLQRFEERHFFKGAARRLLKSLRATKQEADDT